MPSLHSMNENFVIAVKNYAEAMIKVFCSCPALLDFFNLFQVFCPWLWFLFISQELYLNNIYLTGMGSYFFLV